MERDPAAPAPDGEGRRHPVAPARPGARGAAGPRPGPHRAGRRQLLRLHRAVGPRGVRRAGPRSGQPDGAVIAYKGFHPHSYGSTFYAYVRETDGVVSAIQEKQPYTDTPSEEYASSGTYGSRTGEFMLEAFDRTVAESSTSTASSTSRSPTGRCSRTASASRSTRSTLHAVGHPGRPRRLPDLVARLRRPGRAAERPGRHHRRRRWCPPQAPARGSPTPVLRRPSPRSRSPGAPMLEQVLAACRSDRTVVVTRADLAAAGRRGARPRRRGARRCCCPEVTDGQARTVARGRSGSASPGSPSRPATARCCTTRRPSRRCGDGSRPRRLGRRGLPPAPPRKPASYGWVSYDAAGAVTGLRGQGGARAGGGGAARGRDRHLQLARRGGLPTAFDRLVERDGRVNGELYVDSLVEDAQALGMRVVAFPVRAWLSWGTPYELRSFQYWQEGLSRWARHPYSSAKDPMVPAAARLLAAGADRPSGPVCRPASGLMAAPGGRDGSAVRFLAAGLGAVLVDFRRYLLLLASGVPTGPAKGAAFLIGAAFAFVVNGTWTFRSRLTGAALVRFAVVYAIGLALNVGAQRRGAAASSTLVGDGAGVPRRHRRLGHLELPRHARASPSPTRPRSPSRRRSLTVRLSLVIPCYNEAEPAAARRARGPRGRRAATSRSCSSTTARPTTRPPCWPAARRPARRPLGAGRGQPGLRPRHPHRPARRRRRDARAPGPRLDPRRPADRPARRAARPRAVRGRRRRGGGRPERPVRQGTPLRPAARRHRLHRRHVGLRDRAAAPPLWDINAQPTLFPASFFAGWTDPPKDFSLDLYAYHRAVDQGLRVARFPVGFGARQHGVSSWNVDWRSKAQVHPADRRRTASPCAGRSRALGGRRDRAVRPPPQHRRRAPRDAAVVRGRDRPAHRRRRDRAAPRAVLRRRVCSGSGWPTTRTPA